MNLGKVNERLEKTIAQLEVLKGTGFYSRSTDELIGVYKGCCYTLRDLGFISRQQCYEMIGAIVEKYEFV